MPWPLLQAVAGTCLMVLLARPAAAQVLIPPLPAPAPPDIVSSAGMATGLETSVDTILNSPELFIGETVVAAGMFAQHLAPGAFTMQDFDPFFQDSLLVIGAREPLVTPRTGDVSFLVGDLVLVAGQVVLFDRDAFEVEVGRRLPPGLFGAYEGQPVLVARVVDIPSFPCVEPVLGEPLEVIRAPFVPSPTAYATVDAILDSPRLFLNETVVLSGLAETQGLGRQAFTLHGNDPFFQDHLLVFSPFFLPTLPGTLPLGEPFIDRELVQVAGQVRVFQRGLIEQQLGYRLDSPLFNAFEGQVFVLAQVIDVAGFADTPCFTPGQGRTVTEPHPATGRGAATWLPGAGEFLQPF